MKTLHILPAFYMTQGFLKGLKESKVGLFVPEDRFGRLYVPDGKIKVRKPLPNKYYRIGGSEPSKFGWLKELDSSVETVEISFVWDVELNNFNKTHSVSKTVKHDFVIHLPEGDGLYSMCSSSWRNCNASHVESWPYTLGDPDAISEYRMKNSIREASVEGNDVRILEELTLNTCSKEDILLFAMS
ncbi:hypothetical protein ACI2KR_07960 [Pseudomonas luteola]